MRKFPTTIISFVVASVLLSACHKSVEAPKPVDTTAAATIAGNWQISSYRQRTEDKTSQYDGYVFAFTSAGTNAGTVVATKTNGTINGSWSYSPAITYYGSTSKSAIVLQFGTAKPFDRLSKTWNVDSLGTAKIILSSPEIIEDEHLVFVKQ